MNKIIIKNLNVSIDNKKILKNINLEFEENKTYLIVGPNGHGKSTLFKSIFKHYSTKLESGDILLNNESLTNLETNEIANKGLYLSTQSPVEIPGLKTLELLRNEIGLKKSEEKIKILDVYKQINKKIEELDLNPEILSRNINENFSGGEKKKIEALQLELLDPNFIFLDEIDSGLDISAINLISNILLKQKSQNKSIIYISHNDKLNLNINPDVVILIMKGEVQKISDISLANKIINEGYDWAYKEFNIQKNKQDEKEFEDYYCAK